MILADGGMSVAAQFLTGLAILVVVVFVLFLALFFLAGWIDAGTARTKAQAEHHLGCTEKERAKAYWWRAKAQGVEVQTAIEIDVHRRRVRELDEVRARRELSFDHVPDDPFAEPPQLQPVQRRQVKRKAWWEL